MTDLELVKQHAREAESILDNQTFKKAVSDLRTRLTGALMASSGNERQLQLVAEMKALEAIEVQLTSYVNNGKFIAKRKANGRA
jgi:hypothetical protein